MTSWRHGFLLLAIGALLPPMSYAHGHRSPGGDAPIPVRAEALERIVQPVTTVIEFVDGHMERNVGSGFIAGHQYYTVNHNLVSRAPMSVARKTTRLDGIVISPSRVQPFHDLAVFDLPDELCSRHCNEFSLSGDVPIEPGQRVQWLRKFDGESTLKSGTVLNYALLGTVPADSWSCAANLIVEVDAPFIPGSSGAPVIDANSGRIIGMVQGSLARDGVETGYFKPADCIDHHLLPVRALSAHFPGP